MRIQQSRTRDRSAPSYGAPTSIGDPPEWVGGDIDQAPRLVDSIHEVRRPATGQVYLPHAGVQALERWRTRPERSRPATRFRSRSTTLRPPHRRAIRPEDRAQPAERRRRETLDPDPGHVQRSTRCDPGDHVTRPKVHCETVRIAQHERVFDAHTACDSHRPTRRPPHAEAPVRPRPALYGAP